MSSDSFKEDDSSADDSISSIKSNNNHLKAPLAKGGVRNKKLGAMKR
jgi:hypothetical protein